MFSTGSETRRTGRALRAARASRSTTGLGAGAVDPDGESWWMQVWRDGCARDALARRAVGPTAQEQLRRACALPAGSGLLVALERIDVAALSADDAITYAQQMQRFAGYLAGVEARTRAQVTELVVAHVEAEFAADAERHRAAAGEASYRRFVFPEQVAHCEITTALRLSPRTGEVRILEAQELTGAWRPLLDGMLAGSITIDHARAVGRELRYLPGYGSPETADQATYERSCARVLAKVVPFAATHTCQEAGRKARALVVAEDPDGARTRRREAAAQDHGVYLNPLEPGTSEIRAVLPTAYAEAIHQAVRALAKDLRFEVAAGCITSGQRQAAALVALTLGDPGSVGRVTGPVAQAKLAVHVNVLVSVEALIGASEQGGRIGTAPVEADVIRDLLAQAARESSTIRRLVTDSAGCVMDAGRRHYLASDLQKFVLKLRDGFCRFPGCARRAEKVEIDHAVPFAAGGLTDLANLGCLCTYHHQLKTHGGWDIIASARDGSCTWRSPLGRIYEHVPPDLVPPIPEPGGDPPF